MKPPLTVFISSETGVWHDYPSEGVKETEYIDRKYVIRLITHLMNNSGCLMTEHNADVVIYQFLENVKLERKNLEEKKKEA